MRTRLIFPIVGLCLIPIAGCQRPHSDAGESRRDDRLPRRYECRGATGPVRIDGRLNEDAWERSPWSAEFADIEGFDKPAPRYRTRMKMLWDDEYLYIAAELEEPHVWGTLKQHDDIVFNDNDFEIFIDPNGDEAEYYEIEINPLGTIFDLFLVRTYLRGGPALHDWDMRGLKTGIQVNGTLNDPSDVDRNWTIEFALPWRSLEEAAGTETPPKAGDSWRMNFSRVEWQHEVVNGQYRRVPDTKEDNWIWSPQGVIDMHRPRHWGYVTFRPASFPCTLPLAKPAVGD